jgi:hypothetical protein
MSTPHAWIATGKAADDYEFAIDLGERHSGTRSAVIRARESPRDFCTLMQEILADDYRGRVRLRGWIKTDRVERGWCGLWMRVDGADRRVLAFDNMVTRPIKGTTDWTRYEVVLDVSADAAQISFGVAFNGTGAVWLDDVALECVGTDVALTAPPPLEKTRHPRNLDFED